MGNIQPRNEENYTISSVNWKRSIIYWSNCDEEMKQTARCGIKRCEHAGRLGRAGVDRVLGLPHACVRAESLLHLWPSVNQVKIELL